MPEDWGGDVQFINVSAKTGEGVDALYAAIKKIAGHDGEERVRSLREKDTLMR